MGEEGEFELYALIQKDIPSSSVSISASALLVKVLLVERSLISQPVVAVAEMLFLGSHDIYIYAPEDSRGV